MPDTWPAGWRRTVLDFEKGVETRSPLGHRAADGWEVQFRRIAWLKYMTGGEAVMASRMQSEQPVIIRLRATGHQAMALRPDWRARGGGLVFRLREMPRLLAERKFVEILAVSVQEDATA